MERKGRIRSQILTVLVMAAALAGCSAGDLPEPTEVRISFSCGGMQSKSAAPDENRISDISLMIFDAEGRAEESMWLDGGQTECSVRLVSGQEYTICAGANFGRQVYAENIDGLEDVRLHLAYPDDYRSGIPMFAYRKITAGKQPGEISVELERLMAKISLRMDRRRLSEGVDMFVRSVQIGNCPRTAGISGPNRVYDGDECFPSGFFISGADADVLNEASSSGLSSPVTLYMLENMQGRLDSPVHEDGGKTFDENDPRRDVCSYIELTMDYTSGDYYSGADGLIYRFYLGEDRNDLNVERNCHYSITVTPEDDGLSEDGWRVDKSDLNYCGPAHIIGHPSDFIQGNIGDRIHIWCDLLPADAPFDVGESYMKDDMADGIYTYEIDEDGHGATLTLTGQGRGLIYMEAGDPINDAALFIIEVNLP